jgi:hypothetical protein
MRGEVGVSMSMRVTSVALGGELEVNEAEVVLVDGIAVLAIVE